MLDTREIHPLTGFLRNHKRKRVAVGTGIADRPPHRSVRALLTHAALTLDEWRRSVRRDKDAPGGVE